MKVPETVVNLLKNIANGDSGAFAKFYDLYYHRVFKFARFFVKSEELCQEIVSDLFYNLWQGRKNLVEMQNIEGYLYTSIKNLVFKQKKQALITQHVALDLFSGDFFIETSSPEQIYLNHELKELIEKAINELPEKCKLVFIMSREQGLKHKEIAEILTISEHTVHAQLTIAKKKIAEVLKEFYS